jgi:hypothetical protein
MRIRLAERSWFSRRGGAVVRAEAATVNDETLHDAVLFHGKDILSVCFEAAGDLDEQGRSARFNAEGNG